MIQLTKFLRWSKSNSKSEVSINKCVYKRFRLCNLTIPKVLEKTVEINNENEWRNREYKINTKSIRQHDLSKNETKITLTEQKDRKNGIDEVRNERQVIMVNHTIQSIVRNWIGQSYIITCVFLAELSKC